MGADVSKKLKKFESVDLSRLGEILPWTLSKAFRLSENLTDADDIEFSVFDYGDNLQSFENALKIIKSIRHPGVISLKEFSTTAKNSLLGRLVTEPVSPLLNVIQGLDFQEICSGLHDITRTIAFLHNSVHLAHNSIKVSSVFVARDGSWKLGSFENASILRIGGNFEADEKGFISLVESLVDVVEDSRNSESDTTTNILNQFHQDLADAETLDFNYILCHSLFQLELVQIRTFLNEIVLKSVEDKTEFFRSLPTKLSGLPEVLIATRLTKPLLQRFVLLDRTASKCFLPSFLTPRKPTDQKSLGLEIITPILGDDLFKLHVIPILLRIFGIREARIRRVLLENFNRYFRFFDRNHLIDPILSELLLSARDTDDSLVELSLRALADLVTVLGGNVIMGSKRAQCFYDGHVKELKASLDQESEPVDEPKNNSIKNQSVDGLNGILRVERREVEKIDKRKEWERKRSSTMASHPSKVSVLAETSPSSLTTTSPKQFTFTDSIKNVDTSSALFKCKSLESLAKNHNSLSVSKPVAVIEPKTIYQLSLDVGTEQEERRNQNDVNCMNDADRNGDKDINSHNVSNKDNFINEDVTTEGLNDRRHPITNKKEKLQIQKNRSSKLPEFQNLQAATNSRDQNDSILEKTLLVLSKQVQGVKQSTPALPVNLIIQENDSNNSFSDWDDNWEDMNESSIEEPHRQEKISSLKEENSFRSSTKLVNIETTRSCAATRMDSCVLKGAPPCSKRINRHLDQPLGFGYDIKLIEVKSKSKVEEEEDLEWKLFADLTPVIKEQKNDISSLITGNMNESGTVLHNEGKSDRDKNPPTRLLETTHLGMMQYEPEVNSSSGASLGWEAEESDFNLD